jgi:hypothetical protein
MKFGTLLILAITLSSCASSKQTFGPDGRPSYSLNCSGLARNWGMCLEKAGELCGTKGYDIVTANTDRGAIAQASTQQLFATSTISRSMLVSCKQ